MTSSGVIIGLMKRMIVIHELKTDEVLLQTCQSEGIVDKRSPAILTFAGSV
jgi:hypothetical protein